jgi:hypothetical protein
MMTPQARFGTSVTGNIGHFSSSVNSNMTAAKKSAASPNAENCNAEMLK